VDNDNNDVQDWFVELLNFLFLFQHEMTWNDFEHEIIYKNRYFSKHGVIETIAQNVEKASKEINEGMLLFRARIYEYESAKDLSAMLNELSDSHEELNHLSDDEKKQIVKDFAETKNSEIIGRLLYLYGKSTKDEEQMQKYLKNNKEDNLFKGYDKSNSTAPPIDKTTEGRANPAFIRYLYLAESCETAMYEVRPIIGQEVSVAPMKVRKRLKLYDFTVLIEEEGTAEVKANKESLFNVIGKAFTKPNHNRNELYIPTQYLAEYIKMLGFDGIRYGSALHKGGKNIMIFDPDLCEAISSDKYEINNVVLEMVKTT